MISKSLATTAELILSTKPDSSIFFRKKKIGTNTLTSHIEEVLETKHAHPHTSTKQQIKDSLIYSKK